MSVNKVFLLGNVGKDPEIRTAGQSKVASITVATSERWTDRNGEKREKTEWHTVVSFSKGAEFVEKYIAKGTQVMVEGKLRYESYEKDGKTVYVTKVYADNIQTIGGQKKDSQPAQEKPAPAPVYEPANESAGYESDGGDDLPF